MKAQELGRPSVERAEIVLPCPKLLLKLSHAQDVNVGGYILTSQARDRRTCKRVHAEMLLRGVAGSCMEHAVLAEFSQNSRKSLQDIAEQLLLRTSSPEKELEINANHSTIRLANQLLP